MNIRVYEIATNYTGTVTLVRNDGSCFVQFDAVDTDGMREGWGEWTMLDLLAAI